LIVVRQVLYLAGDPAEFSLGTGSSAAFTPQPVLVAPVRSFVPKPELSGSSE
jgi:hypothetical protein